jgi:LysR family hydrogen peroxide-inducible transcriptional activator
MGSAITLKQLRYLVAVADARHFGQAAAACHISQPSLSAQVQQLEETLGLQVFERSGRRVLPTPAGAAVIEQARRVLAEVDALAAMARDADAPLAGDFRLGVIPTLGPHLLPRILPKLRAAYPALRLYLREDLTDRLLDRLEQGGLEAALMALPVDRAGIAARPLFDEPFRLAVPAGDPLAGRDPVTGADLAGAPLLLLDDGHCLRDQALDICRHAGGGYDAARFAATSLETLREMVAGRIGITLLPALACIPAGGPATAGRSDVAICRFAPPEPSRRIGLVCRKGAARTADTALLGDFIRTHLPDGVTPA